MNFNLTQYPIDEIPEITTQIIIIGAAGFTLLLIGFYIGLTENGKYKLFALIAPLGPLFTRIQKDEALEQEIRGKLYDYIETNPGAHYNNILRKLELGNGTGSHHLHMLEKMEIITSRREGIRFRAFYVKDKKLPEKEKYHLTDLQSNILKTIKQKDGISQKELSDKFGKKQQTINYNIKKLERNNLIKLEKKSGKTYCYIKK